MKFIEKLERFLGLDDELEKYIPRNLSGLDEETNKWRNLAIALHHENVGLSRLNAQYRDRIHNLETTNRCQAELLKERG